MKNKFDFIKILLVIILTFYAFTFGYKCGINLITYIFEQEEVKR